jgi:hypothetical protein
MACTLTLSKTLACLDGVGGIKEVKFHALPSSLSNYTLSSGVVTIAGSDLSDWFPYSLELETAQATETGTGSRANGTWFYDQQLVIIVNKLSAQMQNEIKALGQARVQIAVYLMDGTYFLLGYKNGMTVTTSVAGTGTAMGDRNGYTITLVGKESDPAPNMSQATYDTL